jgi:hypothetical protein
MGQAQVAGSTRLNARPEWLSEKQVLRQCDAADGIDPEAVETKYGCRLLQVSRKKLTSQSAPQPA